MGYVGAAEDWRKEKCGRQVLILKRASASGSYGDWNNHDFDVLSDGEVSCRTRRIAVDVDVDLPAPCGPLDNPRL